MLCDIQDYAVWYAGLCRVSAGLCDMVYNTTLYGIQYGTQYGTQYYVASVAVASASN